MPKCGSTSWSVAFAEANKMDNYKDYLNGKLSHFCPTANICENPPKLIVGSRDLAQEVT